MKVFDLILTAIGFLALLMPWGYVGNRCVLIYDIPFTVFAPYVVGLLVNLFSRIYREEEWYATLVSSLMILTTVAFVYFAIEFIYQQRPNMGPGGGIALFVGIALLVKLRYVSRHKFIE